MKRTSTKENENQHVDHFMPVMNTRERSENNHLLFSDSNSLKNLSLKAVVFVLTTMVLLISAAHSNPPEGASVFKLKVVPNRTIRMTIIDSPGTVFWVELSPDEITEYTIGLNALLVRNLVSKNDYIKIHGEIIEFICSQQGKNVTGLLAPNHKALKNLSVNNNAIDTINVTNISTLLHLTVQKNSLKSIDVSTLTNLKSLNCNENRFTSIDISRNTKLVEFLCWENGLTSLDLTQNTLLSRVNFYSNNISSIDLTQNTKLRFLGADKNNLSSIDLSKNTELQELNLNFNKLSSIDLSRNTRLTHLNIIGNRLSALDLSENTDISVLHCSQNGIDTLDLSNNHQIYELGCIGNGLKLLTISPESQLTYVYLRNNSLSTKNFDEIFCMLPERSGKIQGTIMVAENNIDVQYNAVVASTAINAVNKNWNVVLSNNSSVHTNGTFSCTTGVLNANQDQYRLIYPNPASNWISIENARRVDIYAMDGKLVLSHRNIGTDRNTVINVSDLPNGIYVARIESNSQLLMRKIIVKR